MIFLLDKFQFSVNSAFVGHVKIPFSHLLKQAYTVCKSGHISMNFSFFLEQAKYTAMYTTIKLKPKYVLEY